MAKNEILRVQEILLNEMHRLDDDEIMKQFPKKEVQRSGALSQSASVYLKAVNTSLKIKEMSKQNAKAKELILKELGVLKDE